MQQYGSFTDISHFGEFGLIERINNMVKVRHPSTKKGIGDDAALLDYKDKITVTSTDMFLEGIHFDLVYTPLNHLGYKAVVATISDIHAMNALAEQIVVSFGISRKFSVEMVDDLFKGVRAACDTYGIDLVGGDTSSSLSGLTLSLTAFGAGDEKTMTYRNGAKANDLICTTGDLGAPFIGLQVLEREKKVFMDNPDSQPSLEGYDEILEKHLKPEARKDMVEMLRDNEARPSAMIDISDGLASDVLHICHDSDLGCRLFENNLPITNTTYHHAMEFSLDPTICVLNGGEEYQLLFTISQEEYDKIRDIQDISIVGHMAEKSMGRKLVTRSNNEYELKAQGWNAFEGDQNQSSEN